MFSYFATQSILKQSIEQDIKAYGLKQYLKVLTMVINEEAEEDWEAEIGIKIEEMLEEQESVE